MDKDGMKRYLEYRKKDTLRGAASNKFDDDVIRFLNTLFNDMILDVGELE